MSKGRLFAIGIGIAVAIAVGVGLAISTPSGERSGEVSTITPTGGRHFEVNLNENIGVGDKPSSP